jgi:hypothetical protein
LLAASALVLGGYRTPSARPGADVGTAALPPLFADVTAAAGINHKHHKPILDRQIDKARAAWQAGLKAFPDSKELKDRLAIKDDTQLLKFIETQRSLEHPIDTDLSFMDRE